MYRLAYRNFGAHQSLVVNHAVTANGVTGLRWYEIRNPQGTPVVYQASSYAPDGMYRWMGSAAMDKFGNLAIGYSVSSASTYPAIRLAGREATAPLGTLTLETTIIEGGGSQTYPGGLSRWGDYTAISVDPVDDCTFWYTNQYSEDDWRVELEHASGVVQVRQLHGCAAGARLLGRRHADVAHGNGGRRDVLHRVVK